MSQINPFAYVAVQGVQAHRQAAVDKERQLRRAQALEKDAAAHDDVMEHQVESTEEVQPVQDEDEEHPQKRRPKRQPPKSQTDEEGNSHIDLTA